MIGPVIRIGSLADPAWHSPVREIYFTTLIELSFCNPKMPLRGLSGCFRVVALFA